MTVFTVAAIVKLLTRNGSKIAVGVLVAVAVWLAFQSWRVSTANTVLEGRVAIETARANTAVVDLAEARVRIQRGDDAAAADQRRIRELEAAVSQSKESIDALEARYGAHPVGDLTRAHLERLRGLQRAR